MIEIYRVLDSISEHFETTPMSILKKKTTRDFFARGVLVIAILEKNHSFTETAKILGTTRNIINGISKRFSKDEYVQYWAEIVYYDSLC